MGTKERPILFSSDMIKAVLDDRKTQTRRVIKPQTEDYMREAAMAPGSGGLWNKWAAKINGKIKPIKCPYGKVGEKLYIRESHKLTKFNRDGERWMRCEYRYEVDNDKAVREFRWRDIPKAQRNRLRKIRTWGKWRSSRFMYKFLARTWLEITNIGAERVQDISVEDVLAEGITFDSTRGLLKPTKTKVGHWISGGDYNQSLDYCYDCAKKIVDELNKKNNTEDYMVDGGWENHDSDSSVSCDICNHLLDYWPTDSCIEYELDGFETYGEFTHLSNEDRYSLDVMCGAIDDCDDKELRNRLLKVCWCYVWDSLNAKRGYGWDKNPWVWVIEFKMLENNNECKTIT